MNQKLIVNLFFRIYKLNREKIPSQRICPRLPGSWSPNSRLVSDTTRDLRSR